MRSKWLASFGILFLAAALWGCGSNGGSGGSSTSGKSFGTDPATGLAYVSAGECIKCHKSFSWSAEVVAAYLEGKHVIHSDHINAAEDDECLGCHDPVGDGPTIAGLLDPADVPADGLAAVGCEACHGAGANHFGVGPMPSAKPDATACGKCHAALPTNHLTYHPEANNIITDYQASSHATGRVRNSNICVKCHSDEGAKAYLLVDDATRLFTVAIPLAEGSPVQCRTCHDPHNAGKLLEAATSTASQEYRTCTNCHQNHNATLGTSLTYAPGVTPGATTDGASGQLIYHSARPERVITDTHYDDPATTDKIEGYAMKAASERVCRDCHNVHSADLEINRQWAEGAHGGEILEAKEAAAESAAEETLAQLIAIKAAGATDGTAPAWVHYDWDAANRQSCQRCHTATGARNFMKNPATYVAANNDFSHLVGWSKNATSGVITSSGQNEMLYCWGCHANNSGALHAPGARVETYAGTPPVTVTYPDIKNSNVCMSCHIGREVGANIKVDTDADGVRSFINSHYLTAGATLFNESGYEYAGKNYADPSFFAHSKIGLTTPTAAATDSGPCVECHMGDGTADHTFKVVAKDETGVITAINSNVCVECHVGGFALTAEELETESHHYHAALDALDAALLAKGIDFQPAHPYFYIPGTTTAFTDWASVYGVAVWRDVMGAAFNYNLLHHDPGGYAHNRFYSKRLIFDAIDFIDNGVLDGTINVTGEAATYLDGNTTTAGVQRP